MAYNISPQPVYIYDRDKGRKLVFDGVVKVGHTVALKIEDDPSAIKKGKGYVNNAKNDPNEVTLEVMMSQVYTSGNDLAGSRGDRLKNAYTVLEELKTSRRQVEVITTLMTYTKMLLKSVELVQDETNLYGWSGTITFHEQIASLTKNGHNTQATKAVDDGTKAGRTPSVWVNWVGGNKI